MDVRDIILAGNREVNTEMALANFGVYQAHLDAGFTPEQAMQIVCSMMGSLVQTQALLGADTSGD